ncbi:hypothetical protein NPS72_24260, partial [Escherichia coli]|nr:hypothetical protein [Escherichia coli]
MMIENDKEKSLNDATPPEVQNDIRSESTEKSKEMGRSRYSSIAMIDYFNAIERLCKEKEINPENIDLNRPGFPGECFICELRLPDHRFRWK